MAQIASWNGHTFEVSSQLIRSIRDLMLKGSCEAEDKTSGGQQYSKRKNGKAAELSFTVELSALLGVTDVRGEALGYVNEANDGASEYFYLGTQKLVAAKMMLTSAEVTEYVCMPGNADEWISCNVKLTFKQADNGGKTSSKKKSKKKKSNRSKGTKNKGTGAASNSGGTHFVSWQEVVKNGKGASMYKLDGNSTAQKPTGTGGLSGALAAINSYNSNTKKNPTTGRTVNAKSTAKLVASKSANR